MRSKFWIILIILGLSLLAAPFMISGDQLPFVSKRNLVTQQDKSTHEAYEPYNYQRNKDKSQAAEISSLSTMTSSFTTNTIEIDSAGNHLWNENLQITGQAIIENTTDPYANGEIHLFFNISSSALDPDIKTINLTQPEYPVANYSTTTDANGDYTFNPVFDETMTGVWNYTVWYPMIDSFSEAQLAKDVFGSSCFDCAASVKEDQFTVKDKVFFELNQVSPVPPSEEISVESQFTFEIVMSRLNGLPVPTNYYTDFLVNYTVSYNDGNTNKISIETNFDNLTHFNTTGSDRFRFSEGYLGTDETNASIDVFILSFDNIPFLEFSEIDNFSADSSSYTDSDQVTFTAQWTFEVSQVLINDTTFVDTNNYFRTNQTVEVIGAFNSTLVSDASGYQVDMLIEGAGYSTTLSDTTDIQGKWNITFFLDWTIFNDLSNPQITLTLSTPDPTNLVDTDTLAPFNISLQANIDAFTATPTVTRDGVTTLYYYQDGRTITIEGTLIDEKGEPVVGVYVDTIVTNQTTPGQPTNIRVMYDHTDDSAYRVQTDNTGYFKFTLSTPDILGIQDVFTYNVEVVDPGTVNVAYDSTWNEPVQLVESLFTIEYLDLANLTLSSVTMRLFNGTNYDIGGTTQSLTMLNTTFFQNYLDPSSTFYFNFTIRDVFGRIPTNLTITIDVVEPVDGGTAQTNVTQYTLNAGNDGKFQFYFYQFTNAPITSTRRDSTYLYHFRLDDPTGGSALLFSNFEVTITGQDTENAPDPSGVTAENADQDTEESVTVTVDVSNWDDYFYETEGYTDFSLIMQNIRNVTLYYRQTPTGGYNETDIANFVWDSEPWNAVLMNYTDAFGGTDITAAAGQFIYTFQFSEHGVYYQYYIVIYDLAGYGVLADGSTAGGGNNWTGGTADAVNPIDALYDDTYSRTLTLDNGGNLFQFGMGDVSVAFIDPNVAVTINGQPITNGYNITSLDNDLVIQLTLPNEPLNYTYVYFYYRFLSEESGTSFLDALDTSVPYTMVAMTSVFNNSQINVFTYTILKSELQFSTILDFYFDYGDKVGNNASTSPFVSSSGVVQNSNLSQVIDVDAPILQANNFTLEIRNDRFNPDNTIVIYSDESRFTFTIYYLIEDINGTGIGNISVVWYVGGTSTLTINYVINGLYVFDGSSTPVGSLIRLNITIPASLFVEGNLLSYEILAGDQTGNVATFNAQDQDPKRFEIVPPPEGPEPTQTTDDPGTTPEGTNNNALWIITGFIGILSLLTLYYQRHNIRDILQRRARRKLVEGTLTELTDEIRRLGAEGKYRRAILLVWEAVERVSREILQAPRKFNQSAKEFAAYLSTVTIVDRDTLLTLSSTFESARYGKDEPSKDEFEDAVKALEITVKTIIESGSRTRIADDDEDW